MPTFNMTSQELRDLKPKDTVVVGGITHEVLAVGYKWIELKNTRKTIDIANARIKYNGYGSNDTPYIFATRKLYDEHGAYHQRIIEIRKVISRTSFTHEALLDLEPVLIKHGLINKE